MNSDNSMENNHQKPEQKIPSNLILIFIGAALIITAILLYPSTRSRINARPSPESLVDEITPTIPATEPSASIAVPSPTPTLEPPPTPISYLNSSQFGALVLSIREGTDIHLFAYQPFLESEGEGSLSAVPLTRITSGNQHDITPAISPDGKKIAFSANREGYWDLYILDLITGITSKFTNTRAYDGNPSWSPDGKWLAYESYHLSNLDIFIQDLDQILGPIPLTNHPAADYAPNWSGQGRRISFISTRNGSQEVWYADLDLPEDDKAVRIPNLPGSSIQHPTWTTDGRYLSWSVVTDEGNHSLVTWDSDHPKRSPTPVGTGDWPIWGGAGEILYSLIETPYETYLTAYPGVNSEHQVMLPAVKLPGAIAGISWAKGFSLPNPPGAGTEVDPSPLWYPAPLLEDDTEVLTKDLIQLRNLNAPFPQLNEDAVDSFTALRKEIKDLAGWDFLATLAHAYIPLAEPLDPGINMDWLHTGRGLLVNDIPRLANWLLVVKEDFGSSTFWRIFIRTNDQHGAQGLPLHSYYWDFNARFSGSNFYYENGGAISGNIPGGYWIDFTELAAAYGWIRFPAQSHWQFSESAARYQLFAFTQGLSLQSALLELYSASEIRSFPNSANP